MAEFAARHTSTKAKVTDSNCVVLEFVCKVILSFGHCSNKDTDALLWSQAFDVIRHSHHGCVKAESYLSAVGWEVVCDWAFDDSEKLLLGGGRANRQFVEELNHETGKTFKGSGNTDGWADLNENTLGGRDVDLKETSLVNRRVEEG